MDAKMNEALDKLGTLTTYFMEMASYEANIDYSYYKALIDLGMPSSEAIELTKIRKQHGNNQLYQTTK